MNKLRSILLGETDTATAAAPSPIGGEFSINDLVESESAKYGLDSNVVKALIGTESGGRPGVTSYLGAGGLMQIMPDTAREIAQELGEEYSDEKRYDPATNVRWGTYYLSKKLKKYGSYPLALAAYHGGDGAIRKDGTISPTSNDGYMYTTDYSDKIMKDAGRGYELTGTYKPKAKSALRAILDAKPLQKAKPEPMVAQRPEPKIKQVPQVELSEDVVKGEQKQPESTITPDKVAQLQYLFSGESGTKVAAVDPPAAGETTITPQMVDNLKRAFDAVPKKEKKAGVLGTFVQSLALGTEQLVSSGFGMMQRMRENSDIAYEKIKQKRFDIEMKKYRGEPLAIHEQLTPKEKEILQIYEKGYSFLGIPQKWAVGEEAATLELIKNTKAFPFVKHDDFERWRKNSEEAAEGKLTDPNTWAAILGNTLPVMAMSKLPGGMAPMMMAEAESYDQVARTVGIPDEVRNKYASMYGGSSGMVEYAQSFTALGGGKIKIPGINKIGSKVVRKIVEKAAQTAGEAVWEGAEEGAQGYLLNLYLRQAIAEAKEVDPDWQPTGLAPDYGAEQFWRDFAAGAGIGILLKGGNAGINITKRIMNNSTAENSAVQELVDQESQQIAKEVMTREAETGISGLSEAVQEAFPVAEGDKQALREAVQAGEQIEQEAQAGAREFKPTTPTGVAGVSEAVEEAAPGTTEKREELRGIIEGTIEEKRAEERLSDDIFDKFVEQEINEGTEETEAKAIVREMISRNEGDPGFVRHMNSLVNNLEKAAEEYREMAEIDPLMGTLSVRGGMNRGILESKSKTVPGRTAIELDIDHFKRVNDEHGHEAGDDVLAAIGKKLNADFDGLAEVVRLGGEEIMLSPLPDADINVILNKLEGTREDFSKEVFDDGKLTGITFSAGFGNNLTEADQQLYGAKEAGRAQTWIQGKKYEKQTQPDTADEPEGRIEGPAQVDEAETPTVQPEDTKRPPEKPTEPEVKPPEPDITPEKPTETFELGIPEIEEEVSPEDVEGAEILRKHHDKEGGVSVELFKNKAGKYGYRIYDRDAGETYETKLYPSKERAESGYADVIRRPGFEESGVTEEKLTPEVTGAVKSVRDSITQDINPKAVEAYDNAVEEAITKGDETSLNRLNTVVLNIANKKLRKLWEEDTGIKLGRTYKKNKELIKEWIDSQREKQGLSEKPKDEPVKQKDTKEEKAESQVKVNDQGIPQRQSSEDYARLKRYGKIGYEKAENAKPVVLSGAIGLEFFTRKDEKGQFYVTEASTGMTFSNPAKTRKGAIQNAEGVISYVGFDKIVSEIKTNIEMGNISPSFKTQELETKDDLGKDVTEESTREPTGPEKKPDKRRKAGDVREEPSEPSTGRVRRTDTGRDEAERSTGDRTTSIHSGSTEQGLERDGGSGFTPKAPGVPRGGHTDDLNDYIITKEDNIGGGGLTAKYTGNIEAIETLKRIESENRHATPEEQRILAKYVGWGGLAAAFKPQDPRNEQLKSLLTPEEYTAAEESTINAHYTSPDVIYAMWDAVKRMGYKGGQTLEPAIGVGNFFGARPTELNIAMQGVEMDSLSGRIASQLYQTARVNIMPFQDYKMPANKYNLVISNVPFAEIKPYEKKSVKTPGIPPKKYSLHDFYFLKSLYGTKPGGITAFITSRYTMDKKDPSVRKKIAEQADLVTAVRLPSTAFKGNANTEVVTDIIFLQKRAPNQEMSSVTKDFIKTSSIPLVNEEGETVQTQRNSFYDKNKGNIIGDESLTGTMYGPNQYNVSLNEKITYEDYVNRLNEIAENVPANIMNVITDKKTEQMQDNLTKKYEGVIDAESMIAGEYRYDSDTQDLLYKDFETDELTVIPISNKNRDRIIRMVSIRDTAREMFAAQRKEHGDVAKKALAELNSQYDKFVKKYGYLHSMPNTRAIAGDPAATLLLSLEKWDNDKKVATKMPVFDGVEIHVAKYPDKASSPVDALTLSMTRYGKLDISYMAELLGVSRIEVAKNLVSQGLIFEDAESYLKSDGGAPVYIVNDEYLSGNVRYKLKVAKEAAKKDSRFKNNVSELEAVIPKDLTESEVVINMNMPVILEDDISGFVGEMLDGDVHGLKVSHVRLTGKWNVSGLSGSPKSTTTYGTDRVPIFKIITNLLNNTQTTVYDYDSKGGRHYNEEATSEARLAEKEVSTAFNAWLWADDARKQRVLRKYNDEFNAIVDRKYIHPQRVVDKDAEVRFPGSAFPYPARPHQADAVFRITQNKFNMLAHVVGSGKTLEMIWGAMELKRLGMRNKPLIVVPNHMVEQFSKEFYEAYPDANILVARERDFKPDRRKLFINRIATGEWDCVILKQSHLPFISLSPEFESQYLRKLALDYESAIKEAEDGDADKRTIKQMKKKVLAYREKINKLIDVKRDPGTFFWDELGVDQIFVDEADMFKNLEYVTTLKNVRGLGTAAGNKRTLDLKMKIDYLRSIGGGATFATGTPISNTLVEAYSMMRYLQPDVLESLGISAFDEWHRAFAETVTQLEVSKTGSNWKPVTRFTKIVNLPELMSLLRSAWDIKTARYLEQENILVPGENMPFKKQINVRAPATPVMESYKRRLVLRENMLKDKKPGEPGDNSLTIMNDGEMAAIDARMINPSLPDDPQSKLNIAVNTLVDLYNKYKKQKYVSVLFYDKTAPDPNRPFDVHREMKRKLIEAGVKKEEIAFIQDYDTDVKKQKLFDAVNTGKIRIVFGNTARMGAGTNIQKRLKAILHLDAPYRPRDIEQQNGRGFRQGNDVRDFNDQGKDITKKGKKGTIEIYNFATAGSIDTGKWALLETKANAIDQIMTNDGMVGREFEEDYYGSVKEMTMDDPLMKESVQLVQDIKDLENEMQAFRKREAYAKQTIKSGPEKMKDLESRLSQNEADLAKVKPKPEKFSFEVMGKKYDKASAAGAAILKLVEKNKDEKSYSVEIGDYRGYPVSIWRSNWHSGNQFEVIIKGIREYRRLLDLETATPAGTIQIINNLYDSPKDWVNDAKERIDRLKVSIKEAEETLKKSFAGEDELAQKKARHAEVNEQLSKREVEVVEDDVYDWDELDLPYRRRENLSVDESEESADDETDVQASEVLFSGHVGPRNRKRDDARKYTPSETHTPIQNPAEAGPKITDADLGRDAAQTSGDDFSGPGKMEMAHSSGAIERQISRNPRKADGKSGYLTTAEDIYWKAKEIAYPIIKMRKIIEKTHGVKNDKLLDAFDYAVDRVRGSMGIAHQYMQDHYVPIFEPLQKMSAKKRGKIGRALSRYLVAKRSKWLYENKTKYFDAGINYETADALVARMESEQYKYSGLIKDMASKIWAYNNGLIDIKLQHGVIDNELAENLNEPYYVPFNRDIDVSKKGIGAGGTRFTTVSTGIKRIKGTKSGHKIIDPLQLEIGLTQEAIVNAYRADVAQNIVKIAEEYPDIFGGMVSELSPRWRKVGQIEHRTEIDHILSPQLEEWMNKLGFDMKYRLRMRDRLGEFDGAKDEIRILFGATEATKAHELGHAIHEKFKVGEIFGDEKYLAELRAVANSRFEGEEVDGRFRAYVNRTDERAAEFISLYITDRPFLRKIAPQTVRAFEAGIKTEPKLKDLKKLKPSNVKDIESMMEDNYVLDNSIPADEDVISLRMEGKLKHYRVPKELALAVKNLHPQQLPTWLKWTFAYPTRIMKFGAVSGNINFIIPNIVRDQVDAAFNAKTIPFVDFFIGLKHYLANDEVFKLYMRRGGAMDSPEAGIHGQHMGLTDIIYGSRHGEFLDPVYWQNRGVMKGTSDLAMYFGSMPFKPIMALAQASEMGTRLGVFSRAIKSGTVDAGVHVARKATLDFNRFGYYGRTPNEVIPFLNACLEGIDVFARTWKENPLRALMKSGFLYMVALGVYAWNRLNRYYDDVDERDKSNNWIIMKGENTREHWMIPKGHIQKLIVNPFQMIVETSDGRSKSTGWDIAVDMYENASPVGVGNILPVTLKLIIEPITNYDLYWKTQIEKPTQKKLPPGYRFDKRTSESLKIIGQALNISPMMMQHEVKTLFAGTGTSILWVADYVLGTAGVVPKPDITLDRAVVVRRFNGLAEDWNSQTAKRIRILEKRKREVTGALTDNNRKRLTQYYGYSIEKANEARTKARSELVKINKKLRELKSAQAELIRIQRKGR